MRKYPLLIAMLVSLTFASSALAAGYGAAGCGFGGMLIKENKILHQIGAWFLNGLLGNQTFAMTSGTSDCKNVLSAQTEQNQFVENNYGNLAKEMAAGEGENLNTLAGLMGCPTERLGSFASFTKENYASIFTGDETTPTEMLTALKKELSGHPELAAACPRT
ncbi:MAG: DUF3015 family protein [Nitrospirae bacterium]|nr:DUF3015 family protein [Nitrospirota bacterium]